MKDFRFYLYSCRVLPTKYKVQRLPQHHSGWSSLASLTRPEATLVPGRPTEAEGWPYKMVGKARGISVVLTEVVVYNFLFNQTICWYRRMKHHLNTQLKGLLIYFYSLRFYQKRHIKTHQGRWIFFKKLNLCPHHCVRFISDNSNWALSVKTYSLQ